jgi:hypothetical protein
LRVLLDECVDSRLALQLAEFEVRTAAEMGWAGITNGELLKLAEASFDVFVTVDRNLSFQQPLSKFAIAVVLLAARSNRLADLLKLLPELIRTIPEARPGDVTKIGQ